MGFNTVAVLYNDHTDDIRKSGRVGERIADAMQVYTPHYERYDRRLNFGAGFVISLAHADWSQVVIVGRNTGVRADDASDLDFVALAQMQQCLERHGYTVEKAASEEVHHRGGRSMTRAKSSLRWPWRSPPLAVSPPADRCSLQPRHTAPSWRATV
ncbi:hypothetical protein [Methylobacterium sp. E-045]|uniref:hypothetical protein n=1 Tax=Methylobacterium sp. E-045 TaxID=2836575 RepID=UPI001FBAE7AA|nr:hypothetical protein [Methylobacterium sp. E-045]MCJ2128462.1 hypothetical protein [Methylobacterium sp. E-045]